MADTITCPQCGTQMPVETTRTETIEMTVEYDWLEDDYTPPPLKECSVEDGPR